MKKVQKIGIDLGGTNVRLGLLEDGKVLKLISKKVFAQESKDFILDQIIESISEIFNEEVISIGIGVPSIVDIPKGIVYDVHNIPSWKEVHLKDVLEGKFNVQTNVNNDVNCFILGEKHFGKGKQFNDIVGLAMGTGLGGGIVIDGKLYSGRHGGAGEFGLMKYKERNYEYYCSGQFFKEVYQMNGEDVLLQAKNNDADAISIFEQFGVNVGNLINSIMYALNPQLIILGGSVSSAYDYFKESMLSEISKYEFKTQLNDVKIERSELKNAAVIGASYLTGI